MLRDCGASLRQAWSVRCDNLPVDPTHNLSTTSMSLHIVRSWFIIVFADFMVFEICRRILEAPAPYIDKRAQNSTWAHTS